MKAFFIGTPQEMHMAIHQNRGDAPPARLLDFRELRDEGFEDRQGVTRQVAVA
ncbi:hypothetical protein NKI09_30230 [Mesorhizobium sp. M0757]|uniref:hypothetical protein n=1 Tax=unclassified Mesorhizobium TaxID=325217 RepID=UPI00333C8A17